MFKIYIDSTKREEVSVFLMKKQFLFWHKIGEKHGSNILEMVTDLLTAANIELKDVSVFDAKSGPGSFTGLRMGFSIINTLNWALGKKSVQELSYPKYGAEPNITPPKHRDAL